MSHSYTINFCAELAAKGAERRVLWGCVLFLSAIHLTRVCLLSELEGAGIWGKVERQERLGKTGSFPLNYLIWQYNTSSFSISCLILLVILKHTFFGVPIIVQQKQIWLGTMRLWVWSLASLSELKIRCCHELWCKLQLGLRSGVAVAVV